MRNKFKKVLKNRIFIFVLGGLIFGTVGVCAATYFPSNQVTYDNKTSGLESTDVQGAIDELYNTCQSSSSVVLGNYIYFTSNGVKSTNTDTLTDTYLLYKVPITGGSDEEVVNIPIQKEIDKYHTGSYNIKNFYIVDDYIYFTSNGVNNTSSNIYSLYKVPITGGSDEEVVNIPIQRKIESWNIGSYNIEFFNIE